MALPMIRQLALRLAPRLDAATLEKSDLEVMRAAIRAGETFTDPASRARLARLDELDLANPDSALYLRTRFAYELANKYPTPGPDADRLDALPADVRAAVLPTKRGDSLVTRVTRQDPPGSGKVLL